jgi:hypothetical protein
MINEAIFILGLPFKLNQRRNPNPLEAITAPQLRLPTTVEEDDELS